MNRISKFRSSLLTSALALALGLGAFTFAAPDAQAGGCRPQHHFGHGHRHVVVFKVSTVEVCRHQHHEIRYYPCGRSYRVCYTVVTYRDIYSNGTSKTYQVTYQA